MRGMAVCSDQGVRKGNAIAVMNYRRHPLQVDLVHDAIARWDHIHILKGCLGPVNEVKTVIVAAVFDGAVFLESVFFKSRVFHC